MKVNVTRTASAHIASTSRYLKSVNPTAQRKFGASIRAALKRLANFPLIGPMQDRSGVRLLVVKPYDYPLFYVVLDDRDEIDVLAVRHHAQDRSYPVDE